MSRYEIHQFQVGDARTIPMAEQPTEVYSWYGQGEPKQPFIPGYNAMIENVGHDWSWQRGQFRYSGTQVVGEFQGKTHQTVPKSFWVIFQFGEPEVQKCAHCGTEVGAEWVYCIRCGERRA